MCYVRGPEGILIARAEQLTEGHRKGRALKESSEYGSRKPAAVNEPAPLSTSRLLLLMHALSRLSAL